MELQPCGTVAAYKRGCRCDACRSVRSATNREYHERNREALQAKGRAYHIRNRDARLARQRAYNERNRDALLTKQRDHRERNRDALIAKERDYRERNREARLARGRLTYARTQALTQASATRAGRWTPAEDVAAWSLYSSGYRCIEIAFALGRSYSSTREHLARLRTLNDQKVGTA
jgi:hypothetical protein